MKTKRLAAGKMSPSTVDFLLDAALRARKNAYAPYSQFQVGAAILTRRDRIYAGCNVENASYPAGICAERGAIAQMIASGDREPIGCVIVSNGPAPAPPCGICRQVLIEFARKMPIVSVAVGKNDKLGKRRTFELAKLLPEVFVLRRV